MRRASPSTTISTVAAVATCTESQRGLRSTMTTPIVHSRGGDGFAGVARRRRRRGRRAGFLEAAVPEDRLPLRAQDEPRKLRRAVALAGPATIPSAWIKGS